MRCTERKVPRIELTGKEYFEISINGIPHISIEDRILGFQTWVENYFFKIEISTDRKDFLLEYDCIGKWKKVISMIKKHMEKTRKGE